MNVTVKLPNELCREARHRAIDEDKSLSAWLADLIRRELVATDPGARTPKTWMDAFSGDEDDGFLDRDFPLEDRKATEIREVSFDD